MTITKNALGPSTRNSGWKTVDNFYCTGLNDLRMSCSTGWVICLLRWLITAVMISHCIYFCKHSVRSTLLQRAFIISDAHSASRYEKACRLGCF